MKLKDKVLEWMRRRYAYMLQIMLFKSIQKALNYAGKLNEVTSHFSYTPTGQPLNVEFNFKKFAQQIKEAIEGHMERSTRIQRGEK